MSAVMEPKIVLSDAAREEAIERAGQAALKAWDEGRKDDAGRLFAMQASLVRGRSAGWAFVTEAQRGLL